METKNSTWLHNYLSKIIIPTGIAIVIWGVARWYGGMTAPIATFLNVEGTFLNVEGTFLLAFAISFPQGPKRIKWFLCESMDYGSTPSFSYLNFYLGLVLIIVGILLNSLGY